MFRINMYFQRWNRYLHGLQLINRINNGAVGLAKLVVRIYQICISPILGPACRFSPSCSQYAMEALDRYGLTKGMKLAIRRLLRCHPWNDGGFDPVP
jgi:putative membrane protein insertion efficiency factor